MYEILEKVNGIELTNNYGRFLAGAYKTRVGDQIAEHLILYQDLAVTPCLLRINSACFTGDLFGCGRCDCNWQMEFALNMIASSGQGLLIYHLHHEGRGNGLINKLRSHSCSDSQKLDSPDAYEHLGLPADRRQYGSSVTILRDLSITSVRLITNNPAKALILTENGIKVESTVPVIAPNPDLMHYYRWKHNKLGHIIPFIEG